MNNAKNTYLIAINVTNRQKEKYYHEYVPELMDSLQDLSEFRTIRLNDLWRVAVRLETDMLQQSKDIMGRLGVEIGRNEPHLDSLMYMRHNVGAFQEPPDKEFEPSPVWHDDDAMAIDETAKIYLRNVLTKSKSQLGELRREVDKKRREVENVKRMRLRVRDGSEQNKDEVEVVRTLFAMQEDLHSVDRRRLTAEIETSTITSVVGDVTLGAKNHNFKGQTFKIPTNCDLCGERIWGLSAKGFDCRDCGYTCHSKCEMKVPADCPGEQSKEERKRLKAERQEAANKLLGPGVGPPSHVAELPDLTRSNTMNSLSSLSARPPLAGSASGLPAAEDSAAVADVPPRPGASSGNAPPPARKRVMAPPPAAYISGLSGDAANGAVEEKKKGRMLYAFESSGEGELSVPGGREVVQLGPDGESVMPPTPRKPLLTMTCFCAQTAPVGSKSAPDTRRASSLRPTSTSRPRPRLPSRPRAPRRPIPTRRHRRHPAPPHPLLSAPPRRRAPPSRLGGAPRSCATSRRCTNTRRRVTPSTPWSRASASCSSRTTRATAGPRWRRRVSRAACPRAMFRRSRGRRGHAPGQPPYGIGVGMIRAWPPHREPGVRE